VFARTEGHPSDANVGAVRSLFCRSVPRSHSPTFAPSPSPRGSLTRCVVVGMPWCQLVGVYLTVWARRDVRAAITDVALDTVQTGFGGLLGNKGSVAVRLQVGYSEDKCES
jgi:hypothetical protein